MAEAEEKLVEEEEVVNWTPVSELQKHGINVADINKLRTGGIHTVTGVLMQTKKVVGTFFL